MRPSVNRTAQDLSPSPHHGFSPSPREAGRGSGRGVPALVVALVLSAAPATAYANGAFPDSENILTPADRPQEIILVTNFGLVTSADNGKTWLWSCEQDGNALGMLYQLTPLPRNRLFAVSNQNVVYSDDGSCGWRVGGGAVAGQSITDAYLDPVTGTRMMAIGVASQVYSLFQSTDSGATFAPALYTAPTGQNLSGVEIARSNGNIVYLAARTTDGAPLLGRSTDGGAHFTFQDLTVDIGSGLLRIIAIDPDDPNRVLFRFLGSSDQSIAVTTDGGKTMTKPVTINGDFNSFTRLPTGTILVGAKVEFLTAPGLFRSHDKGSSFEMVANPPNVRALSQRNGLVYAATDNFGDGYAIGTSSDEGTTWQGLMSYSDVLAINPCIKAQCQDSCSVQVGLSLWTADVCSADAPTSTGTAGSGGTTGAAGQGGGGAGGISGTGAGGTTPPARKSGCSVAGEAGMGAVPNSIFLLLAVAGCRRGRGARRRGGSC